MTPTPREDDRVLRPPRIGLSAQLLQRRADPPGTVRWHCGALTRTVRCSPPIRTVGDRAPTDIHALSSGGTASTADVAKSEATAVKDTAVDAGKKWRRRPRTRPRTRAETKQQAKSLFGSVTSEVQTQAGAQQQKIAPSSTPGQGAGRHGLGLVGVRAVDRPGAQAAQKGGEIAHWLENSEPRDVSARCRRSPAVAGRVPRLCAASPGCSQAG